MDGLCSLLESLQQKPVVDLLPSHRKGNEVSVDLWCVVEMVLADSLLEDLLHLGVFNQRGLVLQALDLLQKVLAIPANELGELLEVERLFEVGKRTQADWSAHLLLLLLFVGGGLAGALYLAGGMVVSEGLHPLLIVKSLIFADINKLKEFLDDSILWKFLIRQLIQLLDHCIELLEVHIACARVIILNSN